MIQLTVRKSNVYSTVVQARCRLLFAMPLTLSQMTYRSLSSAVSWRLDTPGQVLQVCSGMRGNVASDLDESKFV